MSEAELNRKLADWAGLRYDGSMLFKRSPDGEGEIPIWSQEGWIRPDGSIGMTTGELFEVPKFTQSIDACERWLMPEVLAALKPISLLVYPTSGKYPDIGVHCELNGRLKEHPAEASSLAMAFCLSVEKMIDEETKKGGTTKPE